MTQDTYVCRVHMTTESTWCPACVADFKARRPADTLSPAEKVAEILGEIDPASMEDVLAKIGQMRPDMPVILVVDDKGN